MNKYVRPDDVESISQSIACFNILVHDMINFIILWTLSRQAKIFLRILVNSMVKNEFLLLNSALCKPFYNQSANSKAFKYTIVILKSKI